MRLNVRNIVLLITFLIFGIVLSMQFKTIFENNKIQASSVIKDNEYIKMIEQEKNKGSALLASIAAKEEAKDKFIQSISNFEKRGVLLKTDQKLEAANLKSGLTDVSGPGIIINMNDATAQKDTAGTYYSDMQLIIHDSDILKLINDLKIAGAQAISINDERLISTSGIICAGPTMLINSNKYAVPFIVKAIGNPDSLYDAVDKSERVYLMRRDGLRIDIQKNENIKILKYSYDIGELTSSLEVASK
ncbi:MAG: DUF881 domain-containing protein [Clostridia bacterium]|jgi:uncharacterized protein YlxW (UPF0749 family)